MTLTQKILAAHAVGLTRPSVQAGDILRIRVDWTIASELAWNGMDRTYGLLGRPQIADPQRFFLAVDHTVDPVTLASDKKAQKLTQLSRDFARESGIRHFYDANQTILHTKFYRDLVLPGDVVLGADSHSTSHGGLGAFAIGLGGADITAAMVLGESWIEVPEAILVEYVGQVPFGMGGKEVILCTLGELKRNTVAMERTVEYRGDAARTFSTDMRFTIANMTAEFGGLNGIFEADGVVADWVGHRPADGCKEGAHYYRADEGAAYFSRHRIDLGKLGPLVAKPVSPDNVVPVEAVAGQELQGCFIGACTTTEEELVLGALCLEVALADGQTPIPTTRRLVVPGDLSIVERMKQGGLWSIYEKAGFRVGPPGCSMCLGVASERAGKGENWLSSQNRNYPNRMGEGSLAWLASGPTVAASAMGLRITDPRPLLARVDRARYERLLFREPARPLPEVTVEEPALPAAGAAAATRSGSGEAEGSLPGMGAGPLLRGQVQRFGDHIDTDAIIPGQFCHLTDVKELGDHCFEFVAPGFAGRARAGATLVVAGEGWGSGSSREQAVWALQGAGITAVIARSFAFIHKRNLVNEALPYLRVDDPAFYELAQDGSELEVDLSGWVTHVPTGRRFQASVPTPMIQALQREGGLVSAVKRHGKGVFTALTAAG
jgi:aconitate hydratase/homoaconitate hydratase